MGISNTVVETVDAAFLLSSIPPHFVAEACASENDVTEPAVVMHRWHWHVDTCVEFAPFRASNPNAPPLTASTRHHAQ